MYRVVEDERSSNDDSGQAINGDEDLMFTQGYFTDEDDENDSEIGEYNEETESEGDYYLDYQYVLNLTIFLTPVRGGSLKV